jgi:hydrogenase nickel incorporation protein HypA/HybF
MHEISLVQGLLQQLSELARTNQAGKIIKITMEVGPLSGVVADSFRFGFDILSAEDDLVRGAELVLITPLVTYLCSECGQAVTTDGQRPDHCERCQELFLIPQGGDDLILRQVEME